MTCFIQINDLEMFSDPNLADGYLCGISKFGFACKMHWDLHRCASYGYLRNRLNDPYYWDTKRVARAE